MGYKDREEETFCKGVEQAGGMNSVHPLNILNWYRNLFYKEPTGTERHMVAWAINDLLGLIRGKDKTWLDNQTNEPYVLVYGYSDDLVEIEWPDKATEVDGTKVSLTFGDGTVIRVEYMPGGSWGIKVTKRGTARFVLDSCKLGDDSENAPYSDRFMIYGTTLVSKKVLSR